MASIASQERKAAASRGLKRCSKCRAEKAPVAHFFGSDKRKADGLQSACRSCCCATDRKRNKLPKRLLKNRLRYARPEINRAAKVQQLEYRKANRAKATEATRLWRLQNPNYATLRCKTDVQFKLRCRLRTRLYCVLSGHRKSGSAVRDLGCTISELKAYLEAQFEPGMTWDNWSFDGWHIDHVRPLASFDLTDREQFLQACHYTNLQPLWAWENMVKSDAVDWKKAA